MSTNSLRPVATVDVLPTPPAAERQDPLARTKSPPVPSKSPLRQNEMRDSQVLRDAYAVIKAEPRAPTPPAQKKTLNPPASLSSEGSDKPVPRWMRKVLAWLQATKTALRPTKAP